MIGTQERGAAVAQQPNAASSPAQTNAAPLIVKYAREARPNDPTFPLVCLAIAQGEGGLSLPTPAGDNNSSFGPFQLHRGGALPAGRGEAWANSPAGIKWAVGQIDQATRGTTGLAAISAGVTRFERPQAPGPEITRDVAAYRQMVAQGGPPGLVPPGNFPNPGGALGTGSGTIPPKKFTPGLFDCSGSDSYFFGLVTTPSTGAIGCYLLGALKLVGMAALAGGLALAGVYLILPRGQSRAIRNALPLPSSSSRGTSAGSRAGGAADTAGGASASATAAAAREAREAELHPERVKQARARTSKVRADARTARQKAAQAKQGTGTSYRLSPNAEAQLRRAQKSSAGRGRPDRMSG